MRPAWWLENALRPALMAAMMACLVWPPARLAERAGTGWSAPAFAGLVFLACLEGALTERALRRRRGAGREYWASRAAEWAVLLLALWLAGYLARGLDRLWADAAGGLAGLAAALTAADLARAGLLTVAWLTSLEMARRALELDEEAGRGPAPADHTSFAYYLWLTQPRRAHDREPALAGLAGAFLWGGVLLLLGTSVAGYATRSSEGLALPVLLYFGLGLALLSQARFSVARAAWQAQEVPVHPAVGRRWLGWAALFLAGVSLLALLLPTSYGQGPLRLLLGGLLIVFQVLGYLALLIYALLTVPLALLIPNLKPIERPAPPSLTLPLVQPPAPEAAAPWLQAVGSALLWLLLIGAVAYALYRFVRDRWIGEGGGPAGGRLRAAWAALAAWWRALWRRWRGLREEVGVRLGRRPAASPPSPAASSRFLSLRRLPPRERVRFFYLSAARRAAEAGQPRGPSQTPLEYRAALDRRFPDLEPELEGLTGAFLEARYNPRPVGEGDAEAARPLWRRIQARLRGRR